MGENKQEYMWAAGCRFFSSTLIFPATETDSCFQRFRGVESDYSGLYCVIIYDAWPRRGDLRLENQSNIVHNYKEL